MHVTLTIEADSLSEIARYITGTHEEPAKSEKKTTPAKKEVVQEPVAAEPFADKKAEKQETKKISLEDVRAAVAEKAVTKRTEIKALLTEFGADKVTNLDKEKYVDFLAALQKL